MGRLEQYRGVTNPLNWYPVLTVDQCDVWQTVPYIAWHQPFINDAGNYSVKLRLPQDETIVPGGHVTDERN